MKLEMIGLNHRTSVLTTREHAAIGPDRLPGIVDRLLKEENIEGVVVLSTCNRTEIYISPTFHFQDSQLRTLFAEVCRLSDSEVESAYLYRDKQAARQLFRVASGLDSQMLGEIQVLAQVKQAYQTALELACTTGILNRVFLQAIECGKLVRTRTAISRGAVSVAMAAIEVAKRIFGDLAKQNILLIGAGNTTKLAAKYLADAGGKSWRVINRTKERAIEFANSIGGIAVDFPARDEEIAWADIVVSATSSPEAIVREPVFRSYLKERKRPLLFLDLAVPRDIDPKIGEHEAIYLYTVDDFKDLVAANVKQREQEAVRAEKLVAEQVESFDEWYRENRIAPTIQQLQLVLESIRTAEVEQQAHRFSVDAREEVDRFSKSMMRKVMSLLVANMKRASVDRNDISLARAVTVAFSGSDPNSVQQVLEKLDHELSH